MAKLTVSEYCSKFAVAESTVRYQIRTGKLQSELVEGIIHIIVLDSEINAISQENHSELIAFLRRQIEYLQQELSQALQREDESRQRSDTIILQLTRQFEEQTRLIEDMRHRSMWSRVKTAFGFAAS
jgi:hypothetical protein